MKLRALKIDSLVWPVTPPIIKTNSEILLLFSHLFSILHSLKTIRYACHQDSIRASFHAFQ